MQQDFSLNQALSLYAVEALDALDVESEHYALTLLSVVEAIRKSPGAILQAQVNFLKTERMAELKANGVEYEQRIEELEKIDHPKPEAEFIYETFNTFAKHHPWVTGHDIAPKSSARHARASARLQRLHQGVRPGARRGRAAALSERRYRTLRRTIPDDYKTESVLDLEAWLGAKLLDIHASLLRNGRSCSTPTRPRRPRSMKRPRPRGPRTSPRTGARSGSWCATPASACCGRSPPATPRARSPCWAS